MIGHLLNRLPLFIQGNSVCIIFSMCAHDYLLAIHHKRDRMCGAPTAEAGITALDTS
jgi:hypothetical protein